MKGRHRPAADTAGEREMQQIEVEMDDVELVGALHHLLDEHDVVGNGIGDRGIEAQGRLAGADEFGRGDGIAARKERDVVFLTNQLFGQIGDDALGATIEPGRYAFEKGGNLRDPHREISSAPNGEQVGAARRPFGLNGATGSPVAAAPLAAV